MRERRGPGMAGAGLSPAPAIPGPLLSLIISSTNLLTWSALQDIYFRRGNTFSADGPEKKQPLRGGYA